MDLKRYAAIDIGSNAVRLLINTVVEIEGCRPVFEKTSLVRVPIRLGSDSFVKGTISRKKADELAETMKAFDLLMKINKIDEYKACATSAMREADNSEAVTKMIKQKSGIEIEIIDGQHEAAIIAKTDLHDLIRNDKNYLYVDVGGGSTEFTVFSKGKVKASKSFRLGTVRIISEMVDDTEWKAAKKWIEQETESLKTVSLIGSGGNINHIFKYSGRKQGSPLTFNYLSSYYQLLNSLTYEERVVQLQMKLDRADVIIPATKIFLSSMEWSKARKIYVPKIGLVDGIIKSLHYNGNGNQVP